MNGSNNGPVKRQRKLSSFFTSSSRKNQIPVAIGVAVPVSVPVTLQQTPLSLVQDENTSASTSTSASASTSNQSRFQVCVICNKSFPHHALIQHASSCNGRYCNNNSNNNTNSDIGTGAHSTKATIEKYKHKKKKKKKKKKSIAIKNESNSPCTGAGRFSMCPICHKSIPYYDLNRHAQTCNGSILTTRKRMRTNSTTTTSDQSSLFPMVVGNEVENAMTHQPCKSTSTSSEHLSLSQQQEWQKILKAKISKSNNIDDDHDKPGLTPSSEPLPGLFLFENFITEDEEEHIIRFLDSSSSSSSSSSSLSTENKSSWKYGTFNGNHFGQRWGVHCNLRDRRVYKEETPLPQCINDLIPKLCQLKCMKGCIPNEANAIDYRRMAGHWLKSHVDDRQLSREAIANLSLAGDCLMTFRYEKKTKKKMASIPNEHKVLLKRRTLQVLTGMARYDFSHGISNLDLISDRRISLTMRQSPLTTKT